MWRSNFLPSCVQSASHGLSQYLANCSSLSQRAIGPLLELLTDNTAAPAAQQLARLAESGTALADILVHSEAVPPLVQMLRMSATPQAGRVQACKALGAMALHSAIGRTALVQQNAVPALVACLNDQPVQEAAVVALGNIAHGNAADRDAIVAVRGIGALLGMLKRGSASCQAGAVRALANLAASPQHIEKLARPQCLIPLVRQLRAATSAQSQMAAIALTNIASGGSKCVKAIVAARAVAPLVRLLEQEAGASCQACACGALAALAQDGYASMQTVDAMAAPQLCTLLTSESEDCRWQAARALARLARCSQYCRDKVVEGGVIEQLIRLLISSDGKEVHLWAARALREILRGGHQHHEAVLQAGGLKALQGVCNSSQGSVRKAASKALNRLAGRNKLLQLVLVGGLVAGALIGDKLMRAG